MASAPQVVQSLTPAGPFQELAEEADAPTKRPRAPGKKRKQPEVADPVMGATVQQPALNGSSPQGKGAVPQPAAQDAAAAAPATAAVPATAVVQQGNGSAVAHGEQPASRTAGLASLLTTAHANGQPRYVLFTECISLQLVHSGNLKRLLLEVGLQKRSPCSL